MRDLESVDGGIATVGAAVIGLVTGGGSALLSGVLAYKAGRRQVQDQGLSAHRQWLCQQRQEAYVAYLSACDAFIDAVDDCVLALGTAEATHDYSLYEGAIECVDVEIYLIAQRRESELEHQRAGSSCSAPRGLGAGRNLAGPYASCPQRLGSPDQCLDPGSIPTP